MDGFSCDVLQLVLARLDLPHMAIAARTSTAWNAAVKPAISKASAQRNLAYAATDQVFHHTSARLCARGAIAIPAAFRLRICRRITFTDKAKSHRGSVVLTVDNPSLCMGAYTACLHTCLSFSADGHTEDVRIFIAPRTEEAGHLTVHRGKPECFGYNRGAVAALRALGL